VQYLFAAGTYSPVAYETPTFGTLLRHFIFNWNNFSVQYFAPVVGGVWFLFYWKKHHKMWDWLQQIPIILLVSIITAAYGWSHDQVILIIPIVQAFIWLLQSDSQAKALWIVVSYLVFQICFLLILNKLGDAWNIWLAPALLLWYYLSSKLAVPKDTLVKVTI